jgi:hypothetical protein
VIVCQFLDIASISNQVVTISNIVCIDHVWQSNDTCLPARQGLHMSELSNISGSRAGDACGIDNNATTMDRC